MCGLLTRDERRLQAEQLVAGALAENPPRQLALDSAMDALFLFGRQTNRGPPDFTQSGDPDQIREAFKTALRKIGVTGEAEHILHTPHAYRQSIQDRGSKQGLTDHQMKSVMITGESDQQKNKYHHSQQSVRITLMFLGAALIIF
jgi:hypothetical protein